MFETIVILFELLSNRLVSAQSRTIDRKKQFFIGFTSKLDAMSPLKVLTRGYAMAQKEDGSVLRSVHQIENGEHIKITLSDGIANATVSGKEHFE